MEFKHPLVFPCWWNKICFLFNESKRFIDPKNPKTHWSFTFFVMVYRMHLCHYQVWYGNGTWWNYARKKLSLGISWSVLHHYRLLSALCPDDSLNLHAAGQPCDAVKGPFFMQSSFHLSQILYRWIADDGQSCSRRVPKDSSNQSSLQAKVGRWYPLDKCTHSIRM